VLIDWPFAPLASRERANVRVRVWGSDGSESDWSTPLTIETGLLAPDDWRARFVTPDWDEDPLQVHPAPFLRRTFTLRAGIDSARLYITALGLYEAQINGQVVGDHVLAPGWTVYDARLRYQTFDVTALLHEGSNAIGAILGDGWFRGRLGFGGGHSNIYGERLALLAQLEVTYADGSSEQIITDENWRAATGPIRASGLYDGETYDARLELPGWSTPDCDDNTWSGVRGVDWDLKTLEAPLGPPMRRIETVAPVSITTSPAGKTLVDFGQNLVGRLSLKVQGPAGHTVTLRHAEVLEDGELGTRPLRYAKATDRYTLKGDGVEVWEPRFTFHGFRYAEVQDWPGELSVQDLTAVVIHSDLEPTGWFETSDRLVRDLRPDAQPASQEHRLGHARQLPRCADRLPTARRAPGLDRRPRGLRPDSHVSVRRQRIAPILAEGSGCRTNSLGRGCAACGAERAWRQRGRRRGLGGRRHDRAVGALSALWR